MEGFILLIFFSTIFWRCFNLRERVGSSDGVSKERETDRYMKKVDPVSVHLNVIHNSSLSLSLFFNSYRFSVFGFCECPLLKILSAFFPVITTEFNDLGNFHPFLI